jgi:hypothetical protein
MNAAILSRLAVLFALLALQPAQAQMQMQVPDRGPERGQHGRRFADERPMLPGGMPMPPREFRRDDLPGPGRLTIEERRQLRRDIQDAGQDLYRREPPHRRF